MKHHICNNIICALYISIMPSFAIAQDLEKTVFEYDKAGNIKSVYFSKADKEHEYIKSANVFFRDILKISEQDCFIANKSIRLDGENETFEQFYKGIKVENAGYTFHYDENGCMRYAHGNYVSITNLDTKPIISKEEACNEFAKYEGMSPSSVADYAVELIIKNIKVEHPFETPLLVYKVSIDRIKGCDVCIPEYGYIDAKTGSLVKTESSIRNTEPDGSFHTKYYGTKSATTYLYNGNYYLRDASRGLGIETDNLNNHTIYGTDYLTPISDDDNNWYYSDFTDSTFMALDVHWALQKIYDRLYYTHGKNSIDNNGKRIYAYVNALIYTMGIGYYSDNACWSKSQKVLLFGNGGFIALRPYSTLDTVAHEFGHGITQYQIGWSDNENYLEEGLSDIWGTIMDYRFGDANTEVWKQGEHLQSVSCLRDLGNPLSTDAVYQMADTYNSTKYQECVSDGNFYGMSGVFSHWFYLLVNGGQGYNANGKYYILSPVGMDVAENLIVKAVYDNYLRNTTSYFDVRNAFVAAARAMNIEGLVSAVCNAWYAVGVGEMYLSLTGPSLTCSVSSYTIEGLPAGYSVTWYLNDNYYNTHNLLISNYPSTGHCLIIRDQNVDLMNATLTAEVKYNNVTMQTLTKSKLYAYDGFKGHYTSGNLSGDINYTMIVPVIPNYSTYITSPNFLDGTVTCSTTATTPSYWACSPYSEELVVIMPTNHNNTPIVFYIDDVCGNQYTLYLFASSSYNMNLTNGDNSITVSITENGKSTNNMSLNQPLTIEVHNATTGELVATQTSTSRSTSLSTIGWQNGMYVIKVTVGNESWSEKIIKK